MRRTVLMTALAVAASIVLVSVSADAFLGSPKTTFVAKPGVHGVRDHWVVMRGGAAAATTAATVEDDIEFESSDEDLNESEKEEEGDEDDEDEEAEVDLDPKLAKATQQKAATIKTKMVKEAVAAVVKPPKKKSSSSLMSMLFIPELEKCVGSKGKKTGGSPRGKRKFKPGQAKTLSDLPQLST